MQKNLYISMLSIISTLCLYSSAPKKPFSHQQHGFTYYDSGDNGHYFYFPEIVTIYCTQPTPNSFHVQAYYRGNALSIKDGNEQHHPTTRLCRYIKPTEHRGPYKLKTGAQVFVDPNPLEDHENSEGYGQRRARFAICIFHLMVTPPEHNKTRTCSLAIRYDSNPQQPPSITCYNKDSINSLLRYPPATLDCQLGQKLKSWHDELSNDEEINNHKTWS